MRHGDTDTNACIAGGVLGAIVGFSKLPQIPKEKVLSFPNVEGEGRPRDDFLLPSIYAEALIEQLYNIAPKELEIK